MAEVINTIGRRKTAVARIYMTPGNGTITVNKKDYKENDIERWLMFLEKDISETTLKELISLDTAIEKAEQKIEYLSSDEETMRIYYERERSLHERANMISSAEKKAKLEELCKNIDKTAPIEEKPLSLQENTV